MSIWNFLSNQTSIDDSGIVEFAENSSTSTSNALLVCPLTNKDFITITGVDAKKFLQGQATCDVMQLSHNNAFPGSICDHKGRMITSFELYQLSEDELLLEMERGLSEITLEAITKYSAFFKAELNNASHQYASIGLIGAQAKQALEAVLNTSLNQPLSQVNGCLIDSAQDQQIKLIAPKNQAEQLWQTLCETASPCSNRHWLFNEISQGIGDVSLATTGELIPQMINLQARDGISFKKGCYTGQEIVARMKYLGKLKRRMYRIELPEGQLPKAGQACFIDDSKSNQGTVVSAAQLSGSTQALVVMTEKLAESNSIRFDELPLQTFTVLPLPYTLD